MLIKRFVLASKRALFFSGDRFEKLWIVLGGAVLKLKRTMMRRTWGLVE